jgi:hypothetical protein
MYGVRDAIPPGSSWRKPGPITTGHHLAKIGG